MKTKRVNLKEFKSLIKQIIKEESENPCWKGYQQIGTKMKNGKEVPNCVPIIKEESEYKFDNMVTAFVDEYAIHFVESPEEEAMMIYVVKNGNNIKIKNIEAGFDMKIKPEQYKDYEIKINEMYRKGEIKLPDSFNYNIKDNDITNIDWF
jgi:hypothetical protein